MQAKLRAMSGGAGGADEEGTSANTSGGGGDRGVKGEPYQPNGVNDAEAAAVSKRAGDEAFIKGNHAAAVTAYDASLLADDTNAKVWANRAAAKHKLTQYRAAVDDAKTAREVDSTYVKAWYREGCALTEMGDYESAALAFFEGMQIDGDSKDLKAGFDAAIARGRAAHLDGAKK